MLSKMISIAWRLAVLVALIFAAVYWIAIPKWVLDHGVPVQARVVKVWETATEVNDAPLIGLLLQAQTPDGQRIEFKKYCRAVYDNQWLFERGAQVEVKMDPRFPGRAVISSADCDTDNMTIVGITVGVLGSILFTFLVIPLFTLVAGGSAPIGDKGVEGQATVIEATDKSWSANGKQAVMMLLQVQPLNELPYQVKKLQFIPPEETPWYYPGVQVRVKYDPKRLKRVEVLGPCQPPEPAAGETPTPGAADRLEKLEDLRYKRLITEEEYQRLREGILKSV